MKQIATMLLSTALLSPVAVKSEDAVPVTEEASAVSVETAASEATAPEAAATEPAATEPAATEGTAEAPEGTADETAAPEGEAAAAEESLAIEEITVTARKRKESVQDVPVAVTAFNADMLERNDVKDISDIDAFTPNVQIAPVTVNPGAVVAFIRGVGNRAQSPQIDSPVAISIDGVYLNQVSGSLVDTFDVQTVEVLRGPQGTLQGRNSPGGAINLTTRRPTGVFGVQGQAELGRFGKRSTRFAVEGPLAGDKLAGRLSIGTDNFDGQVWNPVAQEHVGGNDTITFRGGLLWQPSETVKGYFTVDYTNMKYEQRGLRFMGTGEAFDRQPVSVACNPFLFCTPNHKYTSTTEFNDESRIRLGGASGTLEWNLGPVQLTSVTGYREVNDLGNVDVDATSLSIVNAVDRDLYLKQISQELRLSSEKGGGADLDGALDWVAGLYYVDGYFNQRQPIVLDQFGLASTLRQDQQLDSYAAFAHAVYRLTDQWSISAGARESIDEKKASAVPPAFTQRYHFKDDWKNFSFEAGTEFRVTPEHLLYVRYAQGYRSGGIDEINDPGADNYFKPETVDTYEVGAKTEWLDRRLLVNLAVFHSTYDDLQRDVVKPGGGVGAIVQGVANAASATIYGVELESTFRATHWATVRGTLGYLDASYDDFDADIGLGGETDNEDLHLPFTPKWTGLLATDFFVPVGDKGDLTITPDVTFKSKHNLMPLDVHVSQQSGYALFNLSATYNASSSAWGVGLYVRNITDKHYIEGAEPTANLTAWELEGLRRTWGGRVFFKF